MFNLVKGTHDVIQNEAEKYSYVENLLMQVATLYDYKEFRTPILESSELFTRSVGDSSDIVRKEMYTFIDKGGRSITLRPEITAGTIRAMVNNKLFANLDFPVKAFYCGPNFRYERPQQGRYRQFNQFGVECAGVILPERDAEVISLGYNSLSLLGFKNVKLLINTLGDEKTRLKYREALKEYFSKHIDDMCSDCKERFNLNILRILDCKVEDDRKIIDQAPKIHDYLTPKAKENFDRILKILDNLEIPYEIDDELVRGLDYYSGVVFEFHYISKLGKDYGAIGAGGHYSNLVTEIGGPKDPKIEGCGFAMGIERLVSVLNDDGILSNIEDELDVYIMPLGEKAIEYSMSLGNALRLNGFSCDICLENKNMNQMFKKAERRNAKFGIVIGDDEINKGTLTVKNLETKEQFEVSEDEIIDKLDKLFDDDEHDHCHDDCCCHDEHCSCHHHHE